MSICVASNSDPLGPRLVDSLLAAGLPVRILQRDGQESAPAPPVFLEKVAADPDRPETLYPALQGVNALILNSPVHARLFEHEQNLLQAARACGVKRVVKFYPLARNEGDLIDSLHLRVVQALKKSGLSWTILSPNSFMYWFVLG